MKNNKVREFLRQKVFKTGAIVLASALVLTSGSWSGIFRNDQDFMSVAELPVYTDPAESSIIDDGLVPSAPTPPKVTKTTKTDKTTKNVKLKEKSKKTYTKKSKEKKKTTTSKKVTGNETTTTKIETTTSVTSKFTKGSDINKQTTTVTTVTTTTVQQTAASGVLVVSEAGSSGPQTTARAGAVTVKEIAPRVDSRVSNAYTKLGFTISIDPTVNYSGVCDARTRSIVLKQSGDTVYHELGHFLAFIAGNVDKGSAFQQVFEQEKDKYTMYNKAYVCQNSSEYFAESFKNYTLDPNTLRATRPLTYAAIDSALKSITDSQVTRVQTVYRAVWGA